MIVKDLIQLGFSEPEADLMDYIFLHPNCSVQDIVRDTNFRQPEVSVLTNNLGIYIYESKNNHTGKGRPYLSYILDIATIISIKEQHFKDCSHKCSQALQNLRNLKTESS